MSLSIKVGDEVQVTSGRRNRKASGGEPTRGKVIAVDRDADTVTVEAYNLRTKHLKRSERHPQGGRLKREAPIARSRVMLVAEDGKPVRLSRAERKDGKVVRKAAPAGRS